jgi:hypothetical protein
MHEPSVQPCMSDPVAGFAWVMQRVEVPVTHFAVGNNAYGTNYALKGQERRMAWPFS